MQRPELYGLLQLYLLIRPGFRPAWVHVSSSSRDRRQILLIDHSGTRALDLPAALALGT